MPMKENLDIDQGYAWVVLAASFAIEVIGGVLFGCVGLLTGAILEEIDNNLTRASLVSSTMLGTFTLFGPVAGAIQDKVGHRLAGIISGVIMLIGLTAASFCRTILGLIVTFGLITGVGLGLAVNVSGVAPGRYFLKRLPMAYGVCVSGAGLGLFVVGPLTVSLLGLYNLSGSLLIFGGVSFHVCLAGALIRPRTMTDAVEDILLNVDVGGAEDAKCLRVTEREIPIVTDGDTSHNDLNGVKVSCKPDTTGQVEQDATSEPLIVEKDYSQESDIIQPICLHNPVINSFKKWLFVLRTNGFFLYVISIFFCSMGESACMVHLPNYVEHKGSTAEQSANILTGMGATSVISGILTGFAASDQTIPKLLIHTGFLGLSGTVTILLPQYSHSYPLQMVYGTLYGFYGQAPYSLLGPICIELAGLSNLAAAYGLACFFLGVGYLVGPPIASLLYEMSGIYDYIFIFAGCSMVASAFTAAFIPVFKHKQNA